MVMFRFKETFANIDILKMKEKFVLKEMVILVDLAIRDI